MTEQEWLVCSHPQAMLTFLSGKTTTRKLLLFAVACCRSLWHLLDEVGHRTVETSERFADGRASLDDIINARDEI